MYKNSEGYSDPTAGEAMSRMMKEYRQEQKERWRRQYDMKNWRKVYVASAGTGDVRKDLSATAGYSRYVVSQGKMPVSGQHLYPQILNYNIPEERELGMMFRLSLLAVCDELWVFGSRSSAETEQEIAEANRLHLTIRYFREDVEAL